MKYLLVLIILLFSTTAVAGEWIKYTLKKRPRTDIHGNFDPDGRYGGGKYYIDKRLGDIIESYEYSGRTRLLLLDITPERANIIANSDKVVRLKRTNRRKYVRGRLKTLYPTRMRIFLIRDFSPQHLTEEEARELLDQWFPPEEPDSGVTN